MKFLGVAVASLALVAAAAPAVAAGEAETVPLYTNEDLDRMFGPAPAQPSEAVDKATPEDWRWVEQFIDRQYERVDADRRYDLERRTLDIADRRTGTGYVGGYAAWGLGYPASTWWNTVWSRYAWASGGRYHALAPRPNPYARATGEMPRGNAAGRGN